MMEAVAEEDARPDGLARAKAVYEQYAGEYKRRFKWLRPGLFKKSLAEHLADRESETRGSVRCCFEFEIPEWGARRDQP